MKTSTLVKWISVGALAGYVLMGLNGLYISIETHTSYPVAVFDWWWMWAR